MDKGGEGIMWKSRVNGRRGIKWGEMKGRVEGRNGDKVRVKSRGTRVKRKK